MELNEFVSSTIRDIRQGVHKEMEDKFPYSTINPNENEVVYIEFDVGIQVIDNDKTNITGKAGIKVASLIDVGGGVTGEESNQRRIDHRVKFTVPISFGKSDGTKVPHNFSSGK